MKHLEYLVQPCRDFGSRLKYNTPRRWERAVDGGKAIMWFVFLPSILLVGFPVSVVLGYLSGVINGEGVMDRRKRLANEAAVKMAQRVGGTISN